MEITLGTGTLFAAGTVLLNVGTLIAGLQIKQKNDEKQFDEFKEEQVNMWKVIRSHEKDAVDKRMAIEVEFRTVYLKLTEGQATFAAAIDKLNEVLDRVKTIEQELRSWHDK